MTKRLPDHGAIAAALAFVVAALAAVALVAALAAVALVAAPLARADAPHTASFSCRAKVVSVDTGAGKLVVRLQSGSAAIMALGAGDITMTTSPKTAIVDATHGSAVLSLSGIVAGATIQASGAVTRTGRVATCQAAKVVLECLPAGKLLWSDQFGGAAGSPPDATKWVIDTGGNGFGNNELEYYTSRASNVSLDGAGHLKITALRERYGNGAVTRSYTSGKIESKGKYNASYGSIQASIELPSGQGLLPAFWAVGADIDKVGWPRCGEMDIMENLGRDPYRVFGSIHGPCASGSAAYGLTGSTRSGVALSQGFHVYGVDWSPSLVQMTLDGVPYASYTPDSLPHGCQWVFTKPAFLLLDLAVGGNWPGAPAATTRFPATMLVDWVRAYGYSTQS
jgi:beta-glucanase (GH16 family)